MNQFFYFLVKMFKKFNKQSVRFKTIFFCTSLNATRHHRCGNETKSGGLVLRKSASVKLQIFQTQQLLSNFASSLLVQIAILCVWQLRRWLFKKQTMVSFFGYPEHPIVCFLNNHFLNYQTHGIAIRTNRLDAKFYASC